MQYDEHKLVEYFADAPAGVGFSDLDLNNIPHHISCIMDGNGRWAKSRGLARTEGHKVSSAARDHYRLRASGRRRAFCLCVFYRKLEPSAA